MYQLVIAFQSEKSIAKMHDVFDNSGIPVKAYCTSGAEVLRACSKLDEAVVLSGFKLRDVSAESLYIDLPRHVQMLLLASAEQLGHVETEGIVKLLAPVRKTELFASLNMMTQLILNKPQKGTQRSEEDKAVIREAKVLLMNRNGMTEEQAHRFIQKRSMDTGSKMVQTARLILSSDEYCL